MPIARRVGPIRPAIIFVVAMRTPQGLHSDSTVHPITLEFHYQSLPGPLWVISRLSSQHCFMSALLPKLNLASARIVLTGQEPDRELPEEERQAGRCVLALPCAGDIANENGKLVCKKGPNRLRRRRAAT